MASSTVSSKGQVTIPASVREALRLGPGSRVSFVQTADGQFAIVPEPVPVQALKGMLRKPDKLVTVEAMNRAIAEGAASAV